MVGLSDMLMHWRSWHLKRAVGPALGFYRRNSQLCVTKSVRTTTRNGKKTWATRRDRLDVHLKNQYKDMRLNLNAIKTFCEWFRPFEGSKKAATTRNIMVFTTHWPSLSHWLYECRSSWTRTDPEIAKNGSSFLGSQNKKTCETPIGSHSNEFNSMVVTWHQQSGVFQPFWCHHIFEHTL